MEAIPEFTLPGLIDRDAAGVAKSIFDTVQPVCVYVCVFVCVQAREHGRTHTHTESERETRGKQYYLVFRTLIYLI